MPTSYTDQAYAIDPYQLAVPQAVTVITLNIIDENDNGIVEPGDTVQGAAVEQVYIIDTVTVDGVQISGVTFYTAGGGRYFTAVDGSVLQDGTATASTWTTTSTEVAIPQLGPPCFARGTLIRTPHGDVPVETLSLGDLVETLDHGPQPVRWIGFRTVDGRGRYAPVCIEKEALGNRRRMLVSPQHRLLLSGWRAELYFGATAVLAAARHLCNGTTVYSEPADRVTHYHVMFDRHEIIFSEGIPSESFLPGDYIMESDYSIREEVLSLFPELDADGVAAIPSARPVLKSGEARLLQGVVQGGAGKAVVQ